MQTDDYIDAEYEVITPARDVHEGDDFDGRFDDVVTQVSYGISGLLVSAAAIWAHPYVLHWVRGH